MKPFAASLCLLLAFSAMPHAHAFETAAGGNVVVGQSVADDLLAAGQTVRTEAVVHGDLAVSGAQVAIAAPVEGYALAAGRNVQVTGAVGDDLWAAGNTVNVDAPVGDNAMLAGRAVRVEPGANIGGDASIAAFEVTVQGRSKAICRSARARLASIRKSAARSRRGCKI